MTTYRIFADEEAFADIAQGDTVKFPSGKTRIAPLTGRFPIHDEHAFKRALVEKLAVQAYTCPQCGAPPRMSCRRWFSRLLYLRSPHDARMAMALLVCDD